MGTQESEKFNRITSSTLIKKTGKSWQQWFAILTKHQAHELSHAKIAELLFEQHEVDTWWSQMITVGYEQFTGKRVVHQRETDFEISASKTIHTSITNLFTAWNDDNVRKQWLKEKIIIRKATANKSLRITWQDNVTSLSVEFYPKTDSKSQVVVQHLKIADASSAESLKAFWKKKLNDLALNFQKGS